MTKTITNREFLRNYKQIREALENGEYSEVLIPQRSGMYLHIRLESAQKENAVHRWQRLFKKHGPIHVERPNEDLFDDRIET